LEHREVLLTVEVEQERVDKAMKQAARRISQEVAIPGFRKGKAPYSAVVRTVGKEAVFQRAFEELSREVYQEALEEARIEPFAPAVLEDYQEEPLVIKFRVPLAPIVELGDYRQIRIEPDEVEVSDEDVEAVLKNIQNEQATWKPVDRPAQYDDVIIVDMDLNIGEKKIQQQARAVFLDREMEFLPGLNEELVGLSAGDEKEFTLKYDKDSPPGLAGQEISVRVLVHEVKGKEIPPLDDELAKSVGDFQTLEELKEEIRKALLNRAEQEADARYVDKALSALVEGATIEYPPFMLEEEMEDVLSEIRSDLARSGLSLENYLRMVGKDFKEYREELKPMVDQRLKRSLALGKLIEVEGITIDESEIDEAIENLKSRVSEEAHEYLASPQARRIIRNDLLVKKAVDRLVAIAKGEVAVEKEEVAEEE